MKRTTLLICAADVLQLLRPCILRIGGNRHEAKKIHWDAVDAALAPTTLPFLSTKNLARFELCGVMRKGHDHRGIIRYMEESTLVGVHSPQEVRDSERRLHGNKGTAPAAFQSKSLPYRIGLISSFTVRVPPCTCETCHKLGRRKDRYPKHGQLRCSTCGDSSPTGAIQAKLVILLEFFIRKGGPKVSQGWGRR